MMRRSPLRANRLSICDSDLRKTQFTRPSESGFSKIAKRRPSQRDFARRREPWRVSANRNFGEGNQNGTTSVTVQEKSVFSPAIFVRRAHAGRFDGKTH
jgi:hypothetical protein